MTSIILESSQYEEIHNAKAPQPESTEDDLRPVTWLELLPHFMCPAMICIGLTFELYGNFFMVIWIPYVFLPILDYILPVDHYNMSEARVRIVEKDWRFLIPLYATFFMDIAVLFYMLWGISNERFGLTTFEFIISRP
ncbi:hypothetical protein FGO68_gene11353 [Halteria grandinella]|uniref:Uncharacterized protein n=1 Tax=Halteria grandinella TaxID=5974 RepID=A0A8J8NS37_HALGN|nr:hypothetical protein FGO68_gene11353 [Halteria grandinella]